MFVREENGVQWRKREDGSNVEHTFTFNGRSLTGNWVGPSQIFQALVDMTTEERTQEITTDEFISFIGRRIRGVPEMKRYRVEYVNTALGPGHYSSCEVEAAGLSTVTEEFYKTKRSFCQIKKITEK